ncbi:hypothetical protein ACFO5R_09885 [Halosolutus amylolyticus]|uniref:Capsule polysaccharide biosynthesis protein n=1 Tax=Halosolutus amylolyticus TaxID=2932267 RepID=A0ABD5PNQ5_9EURY|nr:hypothetical protein [Halosolutus amylolyticus]
MSRLGYGRAALDSYHGLVGAPHLEHLEGVDDESRSYELAPGDVRGDAVFPIVPGNVGIVYRACILAHAFETRGYEPLMIRCDGSLDICPHKSVERNDCYMSDLCQVNSETTVDAFGLRSTSVGEFLPEGYEPPSVPPDPSHSFEYRGVPVSDFARASTRKYFRKHTLELGDPEERSVYERFLRSAFTLVDAYERVYDRYDVAATVANEVVYVPGGVALSVADAHDVPAYSIDAGFREETLMFGQSDNRNPQPQFSDEAAVRAFLSRPLTDRQRRHIEDLMGTREDGGETIHQYSSREKRSIDRREEPTVGVFTNLIWDASLEIDDEDFPFVEVFDWIDTTIDHLSGRDDVSLVVKTHPAESVRGTNERVADRIEERFAPLASNVRLLPPETDVNTYELIDDLNVGVVYNSTVGLEMAYHGIPVVVGGDTHYRELGFTYDPETKADYLALLEEFETLSMDEEMRERARRYAYWVFVHQNVDFPYISVNDTFVDFEYRPVNHDELTPGNEVFDWIVDRMLENEPIVRCPDRAPYSDDRPEVT